MKDFNKYNFILKNIIIYIIMLLKKSFIKKHKFSFAITLYVILFYFINRAKPQIFYNADGSLKQFGIGYKHKTVVPLWLFAIVLSIISYILISYLVLK